jgi:dimethylhistidine N-methyltransferase
MTLHDLEPTTETFASAVLRGLGRRPKQIPPQYFYDDEGSRLFEAICELDEYYPTRVETALLARHAAGVAATIGPRCQLIELGSGASRKVRLLLDALERPQAYVAVDISREQLMRAAAAIDADYPRLAVTAVCADYTRPFVLPERAAGRRLAFFPGSTIGNLEPEAATRFMRQCRELVGADGALLIGVDTKKDERLLHAAYNDAKGVTAAFNLNLLARLNRELDGDFDLAAFRHHAFYDRRLGRIEMHLVSTRAQKAAVAGTAFAFAAGESIHTENSYKYAPAEFQAMARRAGWRPAAAWTDAAGLFSIHYLAAA